MTEAIVMVGLLVVLLIIGRCVRDEWHAARDSRREWNREMRQRFPKGWWQ